jgi:hypothetical protein
MAHVVGIWAEKTGAFVARFFSEVVASVVTTACVAGATTAYIHYTAISAPEIAAPPKAETADIATLLSPVADPAAPHFIAVAVDTAKKPSVLPPTRPRAVEKGVARAVEKPVEDLAAKDLAAKDLAAKELAAKPVEVATRHVADVEGVDVSAAPDMAAEPDGGFDTGPSALSAADIRARDSLFGPPPEAVNDLRLIDAPQTRRPADLASASATRPADRRLLGMPVPDLLPSGEDVANRVKGWGAAVGSLIP